MSDRVKEIRAAVAAREVDADDVEVLRGFNALRQVRETVEQIGVLGTVELLIETIDTLLGEGAAEEILGKRMKVSEVLVAARALSEKLEPAFNSLLAKITDLTETVPED